MTSSLKGLRRLLKEGVLNDDEAQAALASLSHWFADVAEIELMANGGEESAKAWLRCREAAITWQPILCEPEDEMDRS